MKSVPVVPQAQIKLSTHDRRAVQRLAESLLREEPLLTPDEKYSALAPKTLGPHPSLHIEDLTGMPHPDPATNIRFYQHRARLRAGDGDAVAATAPLPEGYEKYCREQLGLGQVQWLLPAISKRGIHVAEACLKDESVRKALIKLTGQSEVFYVHPSMGTVSSWELAALLREATGNSIEVIAPPAGLAEWVNDKVAFSDVVKRLLGSPYLPRRRSAWNYATLTRQVQELAEQTEKIGIKLPDSGGGQGIVTIETSELPLESTQQLQKALQERLTEFNWNGHSKLLVETWELDILSSPSAQVWIPPLDDGAPVMEGIFDQALYGNTATFAGSAAAVLPDKVQCEIIECSGLLAALFQRLGYIGRCSFDLLLVGSSLEASNLEFIECNGRWGGASTPMTLVNRLFGDWKRQPYAFKICPIDNTRFPTFSHLRDHLADELYDRRTGKGSLILSLPARIEVRSSIDVIGLGKSTAEALKSIEQHVGQLAAEPAAG